MLLSPRPQVSEVIHRPSENGLSETLGEETYERSR
jgi:hypothetical protein